MRVRFASLFLLSSAVGFSAAGLAPAESSVAWADEPIALVGPAQTNIVKPSSPATQTLSLSEDQARASVQWLASMAIQKAPRTFDGDKDWGDQKKLWAGIKVRREGLKLKTHRRFREVNHGRWTQYEVTLPPSTAGNAPQATVQSVTRIIDPITGEQRWQIESSITTPMTFTARIQRWNLGIKLFSLTITGDMRVRLASTASVGFVADYAEVPPALVVDPAIEEAELVLEHFEVNRVSKIGGDVAEEWGEWMEDVLRDRFLQKQNDKLVAKLNRSIDKERGELRLSMADWFANW